MVNNADKAVLNSQMSFASAVGATLKYWVTGECSHQFKQATGHIDMGDHLKFLYKCPICRQKNLD